MAISRKVYLRTISGVALAASLCLAQPAHAQLTTATIRGQVTTSAAPVPGATITAVNVDTQATTRVTAGPDGSYSLTGLRPGTYDISVSGPEGAAKTERVIIGVGETATLDIDTAVPAPPAVETATEGGAIVVTGRRLVETKTMEVATNVSRDQIENLPQNNRNFLNFAALAPGIKVNQSEFRQTFSGAGVGGERDGESLGGPQVNVFIDGVSLKSNVNQGGIVGQDVSRGNPFSQLAVQEFRVLTSNFKAEYEDAGTAIITAVTKSGTNEFHGEVFGTYQDETMMARDVLMRRQNLEEPPLERKQYGAALGGPIIKDSLFFFANYEANLQDRARTVVPGGTPALQATLPFDVNQFRGTFASPFREHLGFAKLNWQINPDQLLEVTGSIRKETDLRDFGDRDARERGTHVKNDVYTGKVRHLWNGDGFVNEFTADYLRSDLEFGSDFSAGFGRIFEGVISVGGRADFQDVEQSGLTFRNNFSLTDVHWNGDHLIKVGGKLSFQKFRVGGSGPNANPQFLFRNVPALGLDFSFPEKVDFGGGDPNYSQSTTQIGLFAQDDWAVNRHLTLNLGVRWDVDTNGRNPDFVTPARAVEALRDLEANPLAAGAFWDVDDYISTGDNRKTDYDNIAPRIGFSYDLNADQRTVFFGGYGRYYDRTLYRNAAEETLFSQFRRGELFFSLNGLPRPDGRPTIIFQDAFLTPEGFQALLDSLATDPTSPGTDELRLIPNDLETPYTDQFSIGVRQRIGILRTSLTYNYTIGKDQLGYLPLNRTRPNAAGFMQFIPMINGYGNAIAGVNYRKTRYHGVFVTVDKPYSESSGYGFGLAYTLAFSKQRGYQFEFDRPDPEFVPFEPNAGDERHRLVANGIVDLPLGLKLSGLATIGSGVPQLVIDGQTAGFGINIRKGNFGRDRMFAQLDLRLLKSFDFGGGEFQVWAEVFNVLNRDNLGFSDACCGANPTDPPSVLIGGPRSFQVGTAFRF
jgi:hypothetical protein